MVCIGTKGYRLVLHHPRQFFSGQWTSFIKHVAAIQGDILITGKDDGQHIQNLSTVLSRLDSYAWLTTPTLQVQVHAEVSNLYGLHHFRCRNLPNRGEG